MTGIRSITMAALMILGLYGCTVMQLRNEVKTDEVRLASKTDELEIEEARQAQLQQEITRLKSDLATRQMSLDDLKVRLEQLQRANDATLAETRPQQDKKRERAVKLQKHQKEVVAIEQSGGNPEEKQKRLQHLKDEIRKSLSMLEQT
jgi:chromosome segregation ATPase